MNELGMTRLGERLFARLCKMMRRETERQTNREKLYHCTAVCIYTATTTAASCMHAAAERVSSKSAPSKRETERNETRELPKKKPRSERYITEPRKVSNSHYLACDGTSSYIAPILLTDCIELRAERPLPLREDEPLESLCARRGI